MTNVSETRDFKALFGSAPEVTADAPGRVNLIGDHTDYNGGYVLPCVLSQRTRAEAGRRAGGRVRAWSANVDGPDRLFEYGLGKEMRSGRWADYVQGVTAIAGGEGRPLTGFDLRIDADLPLGAGVASSASLAVAVLRALRAMYEWQLDDKDLALMAHRAETTFVGVPVGVMDQMAVSLGRPRAALFLDTMTLEVEHVALPASVEVVVIHSGITHAHATGGYRIRRQECDVACAELGVRRLRDLEGAGRQEVLAKIEMLPDPIGRRVRHVVTENERVLAAVDALRAGDVETVGSLMFASHESLKDDYEVSTAELDALVALAQDEPAVLGARMTGGGFGGSVVMLARAAEAADVAARIAARYHNQYGRSAVILAPLQSGALPPLTKGTHDHDARASH